MENCGRSPRGYKHRQKKKLVAKKWVGEGKDRTRNTGVIE